MRRLAGGLLAALGVAVMTAACSTGVGSQSRSASAPPPSASATPTATSTPAGDPLVAQATVALAGWDAQGGGSDPADIVILGDLTGQIGTWEEAVGDNSKAALMVGLVKAAGPLPDDPVAGGEVRWADGRSQRVEVLTASATFAEILAVPSSERPTCRPREGRRRFPPGA